MSWQLFDRLSAYFRRGNIYRQQNLYNDQTNLDKIIYGGEFLNTAHATQAASMNINRLTRYVEADQMDTGEIHTALDIFGFESGAIDSEEKRSVMVRSSNKAVKEEIEDLFYNTLMIDNQVWAIARNLCKYGDFCAELVPSRNRDGIATIRFMSMYNVNRVETKYSDLVGFYFQDQISQRPQFLHPWQVMHMRLTNFESRYLPYGTSILEGSRKHFKQLRLLEDAAIIYRLERGPEKRIFTIPVGNIPTIEIPQYIQKIASGIKRHNIYDQASGEISSKYNPTIALDDIFLPSRPDGQAPKVDQLKGSDNLGKIEDIEYFKKKMVSPLHIPFSRVGIGDPQESDSKPLSTTSPEFAKSVQWVQREMIFGFKKIALVHLALRGYSLDDLKDFDLYMTASSAIEELYRMEVWASRAEVMQAIKAIGLFPDEWIVQRFTNLTKDEIKNLKKEQMKLQGAGLPGAPMAPPVDIGTNALPGLPPLPPAGVAQPLPMEGLDVDKEREVINELLKMVKDGDGIEQKYNRNNSGYDYMMNHNEFDGIASKDDAVLIESPVPKEDSDEAKTIYKYLLTESDDQNNDQDDEHITANDLPV
jgi:hypothetical protein